MDNADGAAVIPLRASTGGFADYVKFKNDLTGAALEGVVRLNGKPVVPLAITAPVVAAGETHFIMSLDGPGIRKAVERASGKPLSWDLQMTIGGKRRRLLTGPFDIAAEG